MAKRILQLTLVFCGFLFLNMKCQDTATPTNTLIDSLGLPYESQSGREIVAYLVDGQPHVAFQKGLINVPIQTWLTYDSVAAQWTFLSQSRITYTDSGQAADQGRDNLTFYRSAPTLEALLQDSAVTDTNAVEYESSRLRCSISDRARALPGFVRFTKIDREKQIVSGRFGFRTWKPGCDTLHFTHGRFDLRVRF